MQLPTGGPWVFIGVLKCVSISNLCQQIHHWLLAPCVAKVLPRYFPHLREVGESWIEKGCLTCGFHMTPLPSNNIRSCGNCTFLFCDVMLFLGKEPLSLQRGHAT